MKHILIITFFLFLTGIIFLFIYLNIKRVSPVKVKESESFLSFHPQEYFVSDKNNMVSFEIIADSAGSPVLGYDLDLTYNKKNLEFMSATNIQLDMFDLYNNQKNDQIYITAVKKLDYAHKIVFNRMSLVRLSFKVIRPENSIISLNFKKGSKKESNIITEKNIDILEKTDDLLVFFGQELSLKLKEKINFKDLHLNLIDITKAEESCRDCFEKATIKVKKNNQEKSLEFKTGGFSGVMIDQFTVFGYKITLKKIEKDKVIITIHEKK